ncbi:MAG: serine/threonine-protein kinase [Myxococcota bacterium]
MNECPEDEVLLALLSGELDAQTISGLDAHLDSCVVCREVVSSLAEGEQYVPAQGDRIGRFHVLRLVGKGAMGVVVEAYDPQLDRRVAIKLLHSRASNEARLQQEARAMAQLSSPHVVTVYDVGTFDGGVFIAMEFVEGSTLREWLETERAPAEIQRVLREAGRGLSAAHSAGVVHRDFKPENVLIDREGGAKVTDFGLARAPESRPMLADVGEVALTRTGALLGTPAYMAPEQLRGDTADERADQYAFAVTAWEALAGSRPIAAKTLAELETKASAGPPAPPFKGPWSAAVTRALSPDPNARFSSMGELLRAVQPTPARRPVWALAALVPVALVGLGVAVSPGDRCAASREALARWNDDARAAIGRNFEEVAPSFGAAAAARTIAALDGWARTYREARLDACEATHVRNEQSASLMDRRMACLDLRGDAFEAIADAFRAGDSSLVAAADDVLATLPAIEACGDGERLSRGWVPAPEDATKARELGREVEQARVQVRAGAFAAALARADAIEVGARSLPPIEVGRFLVRAESLTGLGRYPEAEEAAYEALWTAERSADDEGAARAWLLLARIAGERGADPRLSARHADAVVERAGQPARLEAQLANLLGVSFTKRGELDDAADALERARRLRVGLDGESHPSVARVLTNLGNLARERGDAPAALAFHEQALAIDEAALGEAHPLVGRHHHNRGGVLRLLDRQDEALQAYEQALAIKRGALGSHPEVALTLNSLALVAVDQGERAAAEDYYREALAIFVAHDHADAALVRLNLALLLNELERPEEARDAIRLAMAVDEERLGRETERFAHELVVEGDALAALDETEEARRRYEEAQRIARVIGDAAMEEKAACGLRELPSERRAPRRRVEPSSVRVAEAPAAMSANVPAANVSTAQATETMNPGLGMSPIPPRNVGRGSTPVYEAGAAWD